MLITAQDSTRRFQCVLVEARDSDDPCAIDMMVQARFLDFPYPVSDQTLENSVDIVTAELLDEDKASFVLWDEQRKEVVGHSSVHELGSDTPELTSFYVAKNSRGQHLVDLLYAGNLNFLKDQGYENARSEICKTYVPAFHAAIRNGFSLYSPLKPSDADAYFLRRGLANYVCDESYTHPGAD